MVRDTRGFATKFYTGEGTFDLVANNIPVFFIQDAIKFPDIVHAAKPHPDREIPQAQSAHDTFWDFVSLHTEAQHHTIWQMSDRAIPRPYRMMEGFGIHTFRLIDGEGATTLVKFHWKPRLGVHSVLWEEAQLINGADPDFHRRDLADAIEAGAFPQWELGIQLFPDIPEQTFAGIDLLDPTKIVPEELAPVQPIGLMTLHANPRNYFAETEQVAFHPGHWVPGIDVTDDPLLQGRLFSYLDTQLSRLGGPNFGQLPINRPQAPVNDMLRDGMHQSADHIGVAPYRPNSLDGGCPFQAGTDMGAFLDVPQMVEGRKERTRPASFADHYTQPRLFWRSMSPVEQEHIVSAYAFELGKCYEQTIRERQLACLVQIDADLCAQVADRLGLTAPSLEQARALESEASAAEEDVEPSPALSQLGQQWPVDGRIIGILVDEDLDSPGLEQLQTLRVAIQQDGMVPLVIAPRGGTLGAPGGMQIPAQRSLLTARSIEFDALLLGGAPPLDSSPGLDARVGQPSPPAAQEGLDPRPGLLLTETFRHAKAIGAWGGGTALVQAYGVADAPGVVQGSDPLQVYAQVCELLAAHRVWERFPAAG